MEGPAQVASWLFLVIAVSDMVSSGLCCSLVSFTSLIDSP